MLRRWDQRSLFGFFFPSIAAHQHEEGAQAPSQEAAAKNFSSEGLDQEANHAKRLNDINFPHDDIPFDYIDYIFEYEIMDDPIILDSQHVMDYNNLKKWWRSSGRHNINPVTNIAYKTLILADNLKNEIDTFVSEQERIHEECTKALEEKLLQLQHIREEREQERIRKLTICTTLRNELSEKIEQSIGKVDEATLNDLISQLDRLNKKIKKINLGNAYYSNLYHIRLRIQHILEKRENHPLTTKDEDKLNMLIQKLDRANRTTPHFYSRMHHHFLRFQPPSEPGLLALINQENTFLAAPSRRMDL